MNRAIFVSVCLMLITCNALGGVPKEAPGQLAPLVAALNGQWTGELKWSRPGVPDSVVNCIVTVEQTAKALSISALPVDPASDPTNTCGVLISNSDGPYQIVLGGLLFSRGLLIGHMTSTGFDIDFLDWTIRFKETVLLATDGSLHVDLSWSGYDETVTGVLAPKSPSL